MSLKALANAVIERDRLAGQRRDTPTKSVPPTATDSGPAVPPDSGTSDASKADAAAWHQGVTHNSRRPVVPDAIRAIVEGIEADARAQGWPAELLWNAGYWDGPRGLAAILDESDVIAEVTPNFIEIVKTGRSIVRFERRVS
jgi:hypothetical protein